VTADCGSKGFQEMGRPVFVVGMGLSQQDLTPAHLDIIRSAEILMGGDRHLAQFADLGMPKQVITGQIDEAIAFIRANRIHSRIVVLASGDPLFFGIGHRIACALNPEQVTVLPNITSTAAAFARIKEPWGEAAVVSLHARSREFEILEALKIRSAAAVLTDTVRTPQWLAQWMIRRGLVDIRMAVFERLGAPDESFDWYIPAQAAEKCFAQPNVVILKRKGEGAASQDLTLGMPDEEYVHESGLITKSEVRAVTLAKLRLRPGQTLWDLGAGSGSVGIEAAVLLGAGRIIAVEQHAGRVDHIRKNASRYGVYNHETVHARLPEGLSSLPRPERIFIGGGGRDLPAIIETAVGCLAPGGIVVINTVLLDNLTRAMDALQGLGLSVDVVQLQVSRSCEMPWSRRLEAQSPVWIISARRGGATVT